MDNGSVNAELIIGGVIGAVLSILIVGAIVLVIVLCYYRRRTLKLSLKKDDQ